MSGIKTMWRAGIDALADSPLVAPNGSDDVLTIRMRAVERYADCIYDGLDHENDWHERERDGWHGRDGETRDSTHLAARLNRSGNIIRIIAMPDAGESIGADVAVLNALLYIARYSPDLHVVFDAKEETA